jgi:hypothetical protein
VGASAPACENAFTDFLGGVKSWLIWPLTQAEGDEGVISEGWCESISRLETGRDSVSCRLSDSKPALHLRYFCVRGQLSLCELTEITIQ